MYTITDLHGDPNSWGDSSRANAIVNVPPRVGVKALIVGDSWQNQSYPTAHHAVVWDLYRQQPMIDLDPMSTNWGKKSLALAVNQKGRVVGSTVRPLNDTAEGAAFYYDF